MLRGPKGEDSLQTKVYSLTPSGKRRLVDEHQRWETFVGAMGTVNVCNDIQRKRESAPVSSAPTADLDESPRNSATSVNPLTPHEALASDERTSQIWHALRRLPMKERAAIVLRDLEGLTTEEVAAVLESSPATVRSQISSGRLKLRKALQHVREVRP
jgi:RNA polymerase sigma-70 factor (ECF subfamily)